MHTLDFRAKQNSILHSKHSYWVQHSILRQQGIAQHSTAQHSTAQHSTGTAQHRTQHRHSTAHGEECITALCMKLLHSTGMTVRGRAKGRGEGGRSGQGEGQVAAQKCSRPGVWENAGCGSRLLLKASWPGDTSVAGCTAGSCWNCCNSCLPASLPLAQVSLMRSRLQSKYFLM